MTNDVKCGKNNEVPHEPYVSVSPIYTNMNKKVKYKGKLQTCLISHQLLKDLFQCRYFSSCQEHFVISFYSFS